MTDLVTSDDIMAAVIELAGPPAAPAPLIPDGVFLNMPEEAYHADPALGSTDLKAILTNPVQFHWHKRNPARLEMEPDDVERESLAKRFGKALHKIVLEGPDAFDASYFVEPERPEGLLETSAELYGWLAENCPPVRMGEPQWFAGLDPLLIAAVTTKKGDPKKTAKRAELEAAARHMGCGVMLATWREGVAELADGREVIPARWERQLRMIRQVLDAHSRAGKVLSNGRPETSIFWEENGVRYKARFDYLRTRVVCDLKSYAVRDGQEPIETFVRAIEAYAYDLSRAHYMDARINVLPALVEAGKVYDCRGAAPAIPADGGDWHHLAASPADLAFLEKVAAEPDPVWLWVACSTIGFPEVDVVELPPGLLVASASATQLDEAKAKYAAFRAKFGDDDAVPWVADRGIVLLDEAQFSNRLVNRGVARWTSRDD